MNTRDRKKIKAALNCKLSKFPLLVSRGIPDQTMTSRKAIRSQDADGLSAYLEKQRNLIEKALSKAVPADSVRPATIHAAMRYGLLAGGKRLRPILTLAAAEACGLTEPTGVLPAACAVELIHTY